MLKLNKKSQLHLEVQDYVIRAIIKKGASVEEWKVLELPLPSAIVEEATVTDELALFELIQANVGKLGGKNQKTSIFAPDTSILLKKFDYPGAMDEKQIKNYLNMEIGQSIHIPFQDPLVDLYDPISDDGHAFLFAAPLEEVQKMVEILLDVHLDPDVVDIRALANLRILENLLVIDDNRTFLVADWSITGVSICIYSKGQIEFLRYQSMETDLANWEYVSQVDDQLTYTYLNEVREYEEKIMIQVAELDRMMNFFKFSLHKGERSVDELIVMGDNPMIETIGEMLRNNLSTPITLVSDAIIQTKFPQFKAKHAALLGLALKEGTG